MKKLILFLLLPLWAMAQTTTGQEQEFDYGIKNNSTQTITTPPYLTTTGIDGTQGKIPSALVEKTDNKQNSLAVDGTGTKFPTVDAVNAALPKTYTTTVYVNANDPNIATIFDDENPPTVNDNTLKSNTDNLYIGLDASAWVYNGSVYVTKIVPDGSNFYINSTSIDAGNSKDVDINRIGAISTSRYIAAGSGLVSRLGSSNIENLGSYLRLANKAGSENNQFQLNASNGVDLWNYSSGTWNKRFTFSSAGDLTATSSIKAGSIEISNGGGGLNNNFAIGQFSLLANSTGVNNIGIGFLSLNQNLSGQGNIAIGRSSLENNYTGNNNTAIGLLTGGGLSTGSGNTIIGSNVSGLSSSLENNIILANGTGAIKAQHDGTNWTFTGGIASPNLTGTPTAPTAPVGTNTMQVANMAALQAAKSIAVRKISTATTLDNTDNGKVILLTASCTVTLPNGLMNGFNCSFATQAGATLTYSLGGSVVLINNAGTSMGEFSSHTIVNTGVANEYLTVGL